MKTSVETLGELKIKCGNNWKQILDNYLKDDEISDELSECIEEFIIACKEDTIANNLANLKKVKEDIDNDLLYNNLNNFVEDSLSVYYIVAPLRAMEAKDFKKASKVIQDIFNRTILRLDVNAVNEYENLGFTSQSAMLEFMNMLDNFCSYMVERNYCCSTIERFVQTNMRFSKEMCKKIAEIVDENFQQLKLNYIIDKLKQIDFEEK